VLIFLITADLEAEDMDLGNTVDDDLALDVDGLMDEVEDPEALDSDDEDQLDEELGLDDISEGVGQFYFIISFHCLAQLNIQRLCTLFPFIPFCRVKSSCWSFNHPQLALGLL
jgi:hypothetical protein